MNRPDFSNLVAHFTKSASLKGDVNGVDPKVIHGKAYDRLVQILTDKKIIATRMPWTNKEAVAFTECPFWSLLDHAERYSPYGIGFTKAHIFAAGGNPAIYLRPDLFEKQREFQSPQHPGWKGFHSKVFPFVTPFVPEYAPKKLSDEWKKGVVDYTHEREWRVAHDFVFELTDVSFVIVQTYNDMAGFPKHLKDGIGREKFVILDMYRQIESLWPTHKVD